MNSSWSFLDVSGNSSLETLKKIYRLTNICTIHVSYSDFKRGISNLTNGYLLDHQNQAQKYFLLVFLH